MSTRISVTDPKFIVAYQKAMLKAAFVSLVYTVFRHRKKTDGVTATWLAKKVGSNKAEVSRWFSSSPNWTINTIAALAEALDVEIHIRAVDKRSNMVFAPYGLRKISTERLPVFYSTESLVKSSEARFSRRVVEPTYIEVVS